MANNQSWKGLGLPTGWPFSGMANTTIHAGQKIIKNYKKKPSCIIKEDKSEQPDSVQPQHQQRLTPNTAV